MDAIVLAGGLGTRLRPSVSDVPKPMAPVGGRPFLEYVLASLASQGIVHCTLSVGYMAQAIVNHFGAAFRGMALSYEIEATPLGTGGAIAAALTGCRSDHALVLNGDTFVELDIPALEALWLQHRHPIIVGRLVDDVTRYGQLIIEQGRVTRFSEKGGTGPGLINAGAYVLPLDFFSLDAPAAPFSIEADVLASYVRTRPVEIHVARGEFIDIGIPCDWQRAQSMNLGTTASSGIT